MLTYYPTLPPCSVELHLKGQLQGLDPRYSRARVAVERHGKRFVSSEARCLKSTSGGGSSCSWEEPIKWTATLTRHPAGNAAEELGDGGGGSSGYQDKASRPAVFGNWLADVLYCTAQCCCSLRPSQCLAATNYVSHSLNSHPSLWHPMAAWTKPATTCF